jgi:hypothetical protein
LRRIQVTSSKAWLARIDGRSHIARRARETYKALATDLGGNDDLSEAERILLRRASILDSELSRLEENFCMSEGRIDPAELDYSRTANTLRRLLETTGLKRRAKDVTPSLAEYLNREPVVIDAEPSDET